MTAALFAAHRWLAMPLIMGVAAILIGIAVMVRVALDYAAARMVRPSTPVIPWVRFEIHRKLRRRAEANRQRHMAALDTGTTQRPRLWNGQR